MSVLYKKDVSVILINYNTINLLQNAIASVIEQTKELLYEIIVVDNNSSDNSQEIVTEKFGEQVRYIALEENVGFGRANNVGIENAKGRNILFLNPDTILINNAIKILSDFLDAHENVGACGGNLYTIDKKPNFSYMPFFPTILTELNFLTNDALFRLLIGKSYEFNYEKKPIKVGYVTGAGMMVKAEVLEKTGKFDPDFFMYYEETELSLRIKKRGYDIYSVPDAEIVHLEGKSFVRKTDAQKIALVSRKIFMKKKYRYKFNIFVSDFIYFFICLLGMLKYKIKKDDAKFKFWEYSIKNF